jgi:hypothetical protein
VPGVGGEPRGYLEFAKADGDKAYIKWTIQAVFSTCAEVSFIAHSFRWARPKAINHAYRVLRGLPLHGVRRYAQSSRAA